MKTGPIVVHTARGSVECARCGEGPALLLLHGAMGGYDQGLLLGRTVAGTPGFEFVAISRPGYLATPLALGPAPEQQADLCSALLDTLSIREAAVIAISGGGQTALQFALRHRDRCRALVMISACSAPITGRLPLRFHFLKLAARFPALLESMRRKAAADPERAARRSIPDSALRARVLDDPEAGPLLIELQLSIMDRMGARLPGTENDIRQSRSAFVYPVEQIAAPVLVVHGTEDEAVPFAQAESLSNRIPGAKLIAIPGGRHVSIFTHREVILPLIREFLAGRS